jgi:hypothetical protein
MDTRRLAPFGALSVPAPRGDRSLTGSGRLAHADLQLRTEVCAAACPSVRGGRPWPSAPPRRARQGSSTGASHRRVASVLTSRQPVHGSFSSSRQHHGLYRVALCARAAPAVPCKRWGNQGDPMVPVLWSEPARVVARFGSAVLEVTSGWPAGSMPAIAPHAVRRRHAARRARRESRSARLLQRRVVPVCPARFGSVARLARRQRPGGTREPPSAARAWAHDGGDDPSFGSLLTGCSPRTRAASGGPSLPRGYRSG